MAGRIPTGFIDELLARVDIVEVIQSRLTLKKTGQNYTGLCPFHKEKTGSFSVSQDKQFYYCFGCQASGNALKFIMEYEHVEFIPAIETLAGLVGMEIPREENPHYEEQRKIQKSLYDTLQKSAEFYKTQLRQHTDRGRAVDYLKGRGLSGLIARDFAIGYAPPGWDNLASKLAITNLDRQLLIESGMLVLRDNEDKTYDRFRDRIMFPIRDIRGRVIAFGGRILDDGQPKYLNSPETPVFHKGRELYGLFEAKRANQKLTRILVTEGYMDVVALAQHGISCAVATLGTATSHEHIALIFRLVPEVIFCFDGDKAGRNAAWKALLESLPLMKDGRSARFLFLPDGEDPDSLIRQIGQQGFLDRIETSPHLPEFFFDSLSAQTDLSSLEGKAKLSKLAMPLIDKLPEGVLRQLMVNQLASITGLDSNRLISAAAADNRNQSPGRPMRSPKANTGLRQKRKPFSVTETAIALLLSQPELVDRFPQTTYEQLRKIHNPDVDSLLEVIGVLNSNSGLAPAELLRMFQEHPQYIRLKQLSGIEQLLTVDQLASEYDGAISNLLKKNKNVEFQTLRNSIADKDPAELSAQEKLEVQQMFASRKQEDL
jgi:DNA primase